MHVCVPVYVSVYGVVVGLCCWVVGLLCACCFVLMGWLVWCVFVFLVVIVVLVCLCCACCCVLCVWCSCAVSGLCCFVWCDLFILFGVVVAWYVVGFVVSSL